MPGRIEGAPELVGGWVDGYRIAASTSVTTTLYVIAFVVLVMLIAALIALHRRDTVEGHRILGP